MRAVSVSPWLSSVMLITGFLLSPNAVFAKDEPPKTTDDGLVLRESSELREVYVRPGATLDAYKRLAILDCFVAFEKDWQRDYNEQARGTGQRIKAEDVERIKTEVAAEFLRVFTEELQTKGGYEIVDGAAEDVLVLRPAIINLAVTAPDVRSPGRSTTIVNSAGQMTLYLELYDSVTSQIIARVVDPRASRGRGGFGVSNSVTNKAEADRILRRWADILRAHLDAAKAARESADMAKPAAAS